MTILHWPIETATFHRAIDMVNTDAIPRTKEEQAADAFANFIDALDLDTDDPHLAETPERVARSRVNELFGGLDTTPREHLDTTFPSGSDDLVVVSDIDVQSMCAHHFLPFRGHAHIGYIPDGDIVGLSKFSRLVDGYARRPQVQERLTGQIADAIHEKLDPKAVLVMLKAEHECMSLRGVEEPNSQTTTIALRGLARDDEGSHIKQEFLAAISE